VQGTADTFSIFCTIHATHSRLTQTAGETL